MDIWFKWNMFYTSFLPLWASIVVSDVWSICHKMNNILPTSTVQTASRIFTVWNIAKIEVITFLVLVLYSFFSIIYLCCFISNKRKNPSLPTGKIVEAKRANKLSTEFLLAYILPMIAFDFSSAHDVVLFLIYFTVLSFLCIRNNNIYTNFLFEIKGYRMYECDIECPVLTENKLYKNSLIISKNKTLANSIPRKIGYFDFDNYIYIDLEGE